MQTVKMDKSKEEMEPPKKSPMDFAELRNDTDFITKSTNLEKVSSFFGEFDASYAKFYAFFVIILFNSGH